MLLGCLSCQPAQQSTNGEVSEWIVLFDGTHTDALRGYGLDVFPTSIWQVQDGALVANPDTANVDLVSKEVFDNFELELEWAVDSASNSGIFFHVQERNRMESGNGNSPNWMEDFEIQILEDVHFYDKKPERSAGSLYDLIEPTNKSLQPIGEFNKAKIIHLDGHVEHWLNGEKVLDFDMDSPELQALLSNSKFKENPQFHAEREGHLMFQHHGERVYFRNIRVRRLTSQ